jgi:hypothetical protein
MKHDTCRLTIILNLLVLTLLGCLPRMGLNSRRGSRRTDCTTKNTDQTDTTDEVNDQLTSRYQPLIGILRWAVELGRFDINVEVAKLSSFNCMPRKEHLEAVYSIFGYLRQHENSKHVFDARHPNYDESRFVKATWRDIYGDVTDDIPMNRPESRGNPVKVSLFSDADHAGNLLTRRSHTGLMIFLNNAHRGLVQ